MDYDAWKCGDYDDADSSWIRLDEHEDKLHEFRHKIACLMEDLVDALHGEADVTYGEMQAMLYMLCKELEMKYDEKPINIKTA